MQIGIHVNTFRRPTLAGVLDAVQAHGLRCVHFNFKAAGMPSMPREIGAAVCRRIARELAAREIAVASLSGTFNMIHPDVSVRREGLDRLEGLAAAARPLGTSVIALCTGTRDPEDMWRRHPANASPDAWNDLVDTMAAALKIAAKHDVTLAVEPEVSNVIDSAGKAWFLLDELGSPRLKVIMDGANLFHAGQLAQMHQVLDNAFELLGPHIVLGHAKDLRQDGEAGHVPAGRGLLDYDRYLGLFRKVGFDGPLILHSLAEADVPGCVAFLRERLKECV